MDKRAKPKNFYTADEFKAAMSLVARCGANCAAHLGGLLSAIEDGTPYSPVMLATAREKLNDGLNAMRACFGDKAVDDLLARYDLFPNSIREEQVQEPPA